MSGDSTEGWRISGLQQICYRVTSMVSSMSGGWRLQDVDCCYFVHEFPSVKLEDALSCDLGTISSVFHSE
ncbi:hypothetical protein [Neptuniibacter pectenicola]|uniref:hypothetical protein n=1 Tax=Neptuniibacter pectenicola TaxID=1806669 RepID=UPI0012E86B3E|nr:hypothetical protein [Neptuniibacter pectenicola]